MQTYRQKEQGDTIFLEHVSETGTVRLVIPPQVSAVIARQREQLTEDAKQGRKGRGARPKGTRRDPGLPEVETEDGES